MSRPHENHRPHPSLDDPLIDRLVDGELGDAERRQLLLQLEHETDGWRRCALAFLEAQSWRATFRPLAASKPEPNLAVPATQSLTRKQPSQRPLARLAALAASLAAAFLLGWVWHTPPASVAPQTREQAAAVEPRQPASVEVAQSRPGPAVGEPASGRVERVVKQWEQRGFQTETQKRLVSVELKSGRRVDVPVREVRLRYLGNRTY